MLLAILVAELSKKEGGQELNPETLELAHTGAYVAHTGSVRFAHKGRAQSGVSAGRIGLALTLTGKKRENGKVARTARGFLVS